MECKLHSIVCHLCSPIVSWIDFVSSFAVFLLPFDMCERKSKCVCVRGKIDINVRLYMLCIAREKMTCVLCLDLGSLWQLFCSTLKSFSNSWGICAIDASVLQIMFSSFECDSSEHLLFLSVSRILHFRITEIGPYWFMAISVYDSIGQKSGSTHFLPKPHGNLPTFKISGYYCARSCLLLYMKSKVVTISWSSRLLSI